MIVQISEKVVTPEFSFKSEILFQSHLLGEIIDELKAFGDNPLKIHIDESCLMFEEPPPEHCPGTESENAGKSDACNGCPNQKICADAPKGPDPDMQLIEERMQSVKHKILVLSGKGGVGKSTFSSQLSFGLATDADTQVGLLDIDICGPSIPKIMGLEGEQIHTSSQGWDPVYVEDNLAVMSVGFLLDSEEEAVIWRGPKKNGLIKQFLKDVFWGELDYLIMEQSLSHHLKTWH
eukprot:gene1490-1731_t